MAALERTEADLKVQCSIEARYLPAARAERREAQAAAREAARPAPSRVGWDSRPTLADVRRDKAAAAARAAAPLTKEDKAIRRQLAERDRRWDHKRHATPATMEHATEHRTGALARLCEAGTIDADQLAAALEIAEQHEKIARAVTPRTASFETRIDAGRRGDGHFYEALGAVRREEAYDRWREAMGQRAPIGAVLEMIVGDPPGYSVVAKRWRMSDRRAKKVLIEALDRWWVELGHAKRAISEADLLAAHAGLV